MPQFTKKGLQHLMDRAALRHSFAEGEEDEEEESYCFAEVLAFSQLAILYGWEVDLESGQIRGTEDA